MLIQAFKFVRPKILTTCFLIVMLGSLSAGSATYKTIFAAVLLIAWYIHAASSNDYADRKIDEVNLRGAKDRPLVAKTLTPRGLWFIHFAAGLTALLLSTVYGVQAVILTAGVLLLDYAYSFKPLRISDRGALAQFILPIAYVVYPFSLGYWSVQTAASYPWLLVIGLYSGFIARLFLKDFRDVKGDRKYGKRTFLIRHGMVRTCAASWSFAFASLIILCAAIRFSAGVIAVLLLGHLAAIFLLMRLVRIKEVKLQVKHVAVLARIANVSVLILLLYYFALTYLSSSYAYVVLPLLTGIFMLIIIWTKYRNDAEIKFA